MLIPKTRYVRDRRYRKWLAGLGCIITGNPDVQVAHIRKYGMAGTGLKSSDSRCIPLYWKLHQIQHETSEEAFWGKYGGIEKAIELAENLYKHRFNDEKARELIRQWKSTWF